MAKPMIQIALDQTNLNAAIEVANNVESYVDVIEVGTILAFAEGMRAVSTLRQNHPYLSVRYENDRWWCNPRAYGI